MTTTASKELRQGTSPTREEVARAIFLSDYRNADLADRWTEAWEMHLKREGSGTKEFTRIEAAAHAADAVMALFSGYRSRL